MSLLDRLDRERQAARRAQEAALAARLAEEAAQNQREARERAARQHLYRLYHESPCAALLQEIVKHKRAYGNTQFFGDGLSEYGVRIRWNVNYGPNAVRRGKQMRQESYSSVSALMEEDGTLTVWGKRRRRFSLEQWRRNPQAVDQAIEDAYVNPEVFDRMVEVEKPRFEDIGE